jgi:hypothetical protein
LYTPSTGALVEGGPAVVIVVIGVVVAVKGAVAGSAKLIRNLFLPEIHDNI